MSVGLPVLLHLGNPRIVARHEVGETQIGREVLQLVDGIEMFKQLAAKLATATAVVLRIDHQCLDVLFLHLRKHIVQKLVEGIV